MAEPADLNSVTRFPPWLLRVVLGLWAAIVTILVSSLMVSHWVVLPTPASDDPRLIAALDDLRDVGVAEGRAQPYNGWLGVHVLYADCPCSRRVLEHVFERVAKRPEQTSMPDEVVLLVGDHPEFEAQARASGTDLRKLSPETLKLDFHIESAPLFLVVDPAGVVRYAGGYTTRKQGLEIQDETIMRNLVREGSTPILPLYGCAVSAELQKILDPIGLKYDRSSTQQ